MSPSMGKRCGGVRSPETEWVTRSTLASSLHSGRTATARASKDGDRRSKRLSGRVLSAATSAKARVDRVVEFLLSSRGGAHARDLGRHVL